MPGLTDIDLTFCI